MDCFCFHVKKEISVDDAWEELENAGFPLLYSSEDFGGDKEIYGYIPSFLSFESILKSVRSVQKVTETVLDIDWNEQWAFHSPEFQFGVLQLDLQQLGGQGMLVLQPGPGFGDLSHPTTRLMLKLIKNRVKGRNVIDIGCGSGILALTAAALNGKSVFAIDIDPAAVEHARKNARLNQIEEKVSFFLPQEFFLPKEINTALVCMNMIRSEQRQAWESLPMLHYLKGESIVSGVLSKERGAYLELCASWGWKVVEEIEDSGWLAFCFTRL